MMGNFDTCTGCELLEVKVPIVFLVTAGFSRLREGCYTGRTNLQHSRNSPEGTMQTTYILAPSCDYPPGSSIALGRILSDPYDPGTCLNPDGPPPFPANMLQQSHPLENWKCTLPRSHSRSFEVWVMLAKLFLGVTTEASFGCEVPKASFTTLAKSSPHLSTRLTSTMRISSRVLQLRNTSPTMPPRNGFT